MPLAHAPPASAPPRTGSAMGVLARQPSVQGARQAWASRRASSASRAVVQVARAAPSLNTTRMKGHVAINLHIGGVRGTTGSVPAGLAPQPSAISPVGPSLAASHIHPGFSGSAAVLFTWNLS